MATYILATSKSWHTDLFEALSSSVAGRWIRISDKNDLTYENLKELNPDYVFIPHWSHIIPAEVYENFRCIVFHMTDLPFGRGGSPLQNLIVRGVKETKISALQVTKGIDTGDIYLKRELSLAGTAREIFIRSSSIIESMIREILEDNPVPQPQEGEVVVFKRRKPEEGKINDLEELEEVYDYIRMLDCEGYPPAFIELPHFRLEFTRAAIQSDQSIKADVRIFKK